MLCYAMLCRPAASCRGSPRRAARHAMLCYATLTPRRAARHAMLCYATLTPRRAARPPSAARSSAAWCLHRQKTEARSASGALAARLVAHPLPRNAPSCAPRFYERAAHARPEGLSAAVEQRAAGGRVLGVGSVGRDPYCQHPLALDRGFRRLRHHGQAHWARRRARRLAEAEEQLARDDAAGREVPSIA